MPRAHDFFNIKILGAGLLLATQLYAADYTILNQQAYQQTVRTSRAKITAYLNHAELPSRSNERIDKIVDKLRGIPYRFTGAMGEGDWQPDSKQYRSGALHADQNPVYRLDGLDCQTFVQMVMALYYSKNINQFDNNYIQIAYGAKNLNAPNAVQFCNRNHFIEADFNRVNQQRGFLKDVTSSGLLATYSQSVNIVFSKQEWFAKKLLSSSDNVYVLNKNDGKKMLRRFAWFKGKFFNHQSQIISVTYLPKQTIALPSGNGGYIPNQNLLDLIPTPSIAEIVNDPKRWYSNGESIKDLMGTEISISHLGVLYRKAFSQGELIYHRIQCGRYAGVLQCSVKPIRCEKTACHELMFAHATDMYPSRFYWYQLPDGNYTCVPDKPKNQAPYTTCNRVEALPLFNYLTNNQAGSFWYMNTPSILGVHVEKLIISRQN